MESLGVAYVHIPVEFGAPTEANLLAFFDAMDARGELSTLVHCAANYRVTAFVGLYRVIRHGWSRDDAFALMEDVWQPNDVWALFIDEMLGKHGNGQPRTD